MVSKIKAIKVLFGFIALFILAFTQLSYADWSIGVGIGDSREHHDRDRQDHWRDRERERHFFYYRDHPDYGYRLHFLPDGGYIVWVNGEKYYYYDGLYYAREGFDYVLVNPPIGAYVSAIPPDFQPVMINGRTYYTNSGIYYVMTHRGYKVVRAPVVYEQPQPVIVQAPQQVVVAQPPIVSPQGSFPVNIPNGTGAYTTVLIKKSGNGYVGPQGEFYANFPSVSQLKAMYAK